MFSSFLKKGFLLFLPVLAALSSGAQTFSVKGRIISKADTVPLTGAIIRLTSVTDTGTVSAAAADMNGRFELTNVAPGRYRLSSAYISYKPVQKLVVVTDKDTDLGTIAAAPDASLLKTVTVETEQQRAEQRGDTTQFNAGAYKTNPDATAEDLVKKLPGVTSDGSTVKVNGEEVKKVMIDGKPFFGDDPTAALKNLPADVVDKVQIYDKASDQAQFTGFKDGDEQKAMNIITKPGRNEGQFGKAYAGYGTDDRYNSGLMLNSFDDKRRISVIGMSNNINQQNFNISDIMSVISNAGMQGGGPGGPGGGAAGNFMTGQQSGVAQTHAAGINYSDSWGKKINVTGSYFFNQTDNTGISSIARNYFTDNKLVYDENSNSRTKNLNHKVNFRLEYAVDTMNTITINPRLTFQQTNAASTLTGTNRLPDSALFLSRTDNHTSALNTGYNFQNDLLLQHKFRKKGRTISLNINTQINDRSGNGSYYSSSIYNDSVTTGTVLDQQYTNTGNTNTWTGNLSYTEPLGANGQVMLTYRASHNRSNADKTTKDVDGGGEYTITNTALSNIYDNTYTSQRGGLNYRYNKDKINFTTGADVEHAVLNGDQTYPFTSKLSRSYTNILPSAMFSYRFSKTKNLSINYRSSTEWPSITQLQNVIDISNPLLVKSGNAGLKQTYRNIIFIRLGMGNHMQVKHFFIFFTANQTLHYISNATYLLRNDTTLQGYTISRGSQLTKPVNLDNYYSLRSFGVYSFPVQAIRSNLNINAGYTYSHTPALINDRINYSGNQAVSGGIYLSSNISTALDFSIAYNGSYNTVKNTLQAESDNAYFNHTATLKVNYILLKRIVLNTDVNQMYYTGLTKSYNQDFVLWNAYIGYKFLKNQSLEAKISVYDILNQNKSISRTVTETYTEDSSTNVIKRYFMLTLTYTFKHFKNGSQEPEQFQFPKGMPPPGSMPPPGGMHPPPGN